MFFFTEGTYRRFVNRGNSKQDRSVLSYVKILLLVKTCEDDNRRNDGLVGERFQICHINTLYRQLNQELCGVKATMSLSPKYNGKNLKVAIAGQNRCQYAISMLA